MEREEEWNESSKERERETKRKCWKRNMDEASALVRDGLCLLAVSFVNAFVLMNGAVGRDGGGLENRCVLLWGAQQNRPHSFTP